MVVLLIAVLLAALTSGCGSPTAVPESTEQVDNPVQMGTTQQTGQAVLNREGQGSYSADFQVQFTGAASWSYQLKIRQSSELQEINLHIEGLPPAQNPGDIRLVTDGAQTWLLGAGTDQECIQFPNGQGMDPSFIYPESLVSLPDLNDTFRLVGEETYGAESAVGAVTLLNFRANNAVTGPWKNATVDIRQEKAGGTLYLFSMQADGQDPFFGAGSGKLTANYRRSVLGDAGIEPVPGCEISVTLPEDAAAFVRLPGMASFESQSSADALLAFYQSLLPQENWTETEPAALANGAHILSYRRDAEEVEIYIESTESGGSKVTILFMKGE
jgi:hypothetical protein